VFLVNSRLSRFAAAPARSTGKRLHALGHPFSRSYGVNLPSSLTMDHSSTLAHLCPATSVGLRYGRSELPPTCVSGRIGLPALPALRPARLRLTPTKGATRFDAASPSRRAGYRSPHTLET
jgi:hypothetical protein